MKSKLSNRPRVSILIPTYNHGNYIQQAVESALNQTYTEYEVIVIDDGSTDNTREILHPYVAEELINYVYRDNKGLSVVREYGLQMAHGDFVIFLDARDFFLPTMLAEMVASFDAQPSLGMLVSGYSHVNTQGKIVSSVKPWHQFPQLNLETWLLWKPINLSTVIFRRKWLEDEVKFDADYFPLENLELFWHLALKGCQANWSRRVSVCCRDHEHSNPQDTSRLVKVLDTLYNKLFRRADLPQDIVKVESKLRYNYLVWLSWCAYQNGHFKAMADYLHRALLYTSSLPNEILSDWTEQLIYYAHIHGRYINAYTLNKLSEWQDLVKYLIFPKAPLIANVIEANLERVDPAKNALNLIHKTYDFDCYKNNFLIGFDRESIEQNCRLFNNYLEVSQVLQLSAPKVSIITSVFKGDKYIEHFLEDITGQTVFNQCELILINPNSPGNEESVIKNYLKKYPNILYKRLESDPGLYETWNMAIMMARGKYITNANLDDRHSPQHIEKHIEWLEKYSEYDVVCAPVLVTKCINETWENNTAYTVWYEGFIHGKDQYLGVQEFFQPEYENGIKTGRVLSYNFPHCMPVWRKSIHEINGYFDEQNYGTSADWEFWLRCAANGSKFKLLKEPLVLYLEDPQSHNRTDKNKENFENKIIDKYLVYARKPLVSIKIPNKTEEDNQGWVTYPRSVDLSGALGGNYGNHRSGWGYVMHGLSPLHNELGIWVDSFIEKKFVWGNDPGDRKNNPQPYKKPWIGFIHVPPYVPRWFQSEQAPLTIFATKLWQESMKYCLGLFCLSEYHKAWLEEHLDVPIVSLLHPTETPDVKFSMDAFLANPDRKIVQVGWWLRKLHSIYYLPTKKIKKAILRSGQEHIEEMFIAEKKALNLQPDESLVEQISFLPNDQYDEFLAKNIVYVEFYDTSANNIVIECLVRNTPILVNPLPAVKEYLGDDYPFYFQDLEEAAQKADDMGLIEEAHNYLKYHAIKEKLTAEYFLNSFAESDIYKALS